MIERLDLQPRHRKQIERDYVVLVRGHEGA